MSLTIKAFLHEQSWRAEPKEIRRFTVDQDVSTSFAYLLEKVAQVFPSVQAGNIIVAWMDNDGDLIVISSDEELVQALDQFDGSVFRLYLKKRSNVTFQGETFSSPPFEAKPPAEGGAGESSEQQQQKPAEAQPSSQQSQQGQGGGAFHPGVVCDGCSSPICGVRYKCLVCHDYDLCSGCEAKGMHVDHNMVTITDPASYNPWGFQNPWARGGFGGGGNPCHGGWWGQRPGPHGFPGHHGFGPHGFQHPCSGGGPWRFGGGAPPCFRGGHPGRRWGGGTCSGAPWWRRAAEKEAAGKTSGTSEPMETGATESQQQQQQQPQAGPPQSEEDRKTFLQGVGQAVSSFLEPFGVKVDVDVLGGGEEKTPTSSGEGASAEDVPKEVLDQTLAQLQSMGYQDEGGWLSELVKAKGGDISKVLDALHPATDATISETD